MKERRGRARWFHTTTRPERSTGSCRLFEMPAGGLGLVWLDGRNQGKQPEDAEMAMYFASYRHGMEADGRSVRQRARLRVLHDVSRGHTRRRRRGVPRSQREGDPRHSRLASREREMDATRKSCTPTTGRSTPVRSTDRH